MKPIAFLLPAWMMTSSIRTLLEEITKRIEPVSDSAHLDAQVLLSRSIQRNRGFIAAHPELDLSSEQIDIVRAMTDRVARGEPLPYVIGEWEFFGRAFIVTPHVLIPRPETELLVEKALAWLKANPGKCNVIDVGTGSGCIAVSIALENPAAKITATDISPSVLDVAHQNVERHHAEDRIELIECDLFPVNLQPATFNLILSNPPYIPTSTLQNLSVFNKEPTLALDGGADGMETIRRLLALGSGMLDYRGMILFEIESTLGREAFQLCRTAFPNAEISLEKDLNGLDRLIMIET